MCVITGKQEGGTGGESTDQGGLDPTDSSCAAVLDPQEDFQEAARSCVPQESSWGLLVRTPHLHTPILTHQGPKSTPQEFNLTTLLDCIT